MSSMNGSSENDGIMSGITGSSDNDVDVGTTMANSSESDDDSIKYTSAPKTETSDDGNTCTWYSGSICSRPRSCYDCLNVVIPGDNCAINPYGVCMNSYMVSRVEGYHMTNYSYCPAEESVCAACRVDWARAYEAGEQISTSAKCVGESGCICLASCEQPDRDSYIVGIWCIPALSNAQFRLVAGLIGGTIAFFVIATIVIKRQLGRRQRRNRENQTVQRSLRPSASAHLPKLSLSGWAGMREKLVQSEQNLLEGGTSSTLPTLARSSTTRPAVGEEEGDAYRSLSPSENSTHRREL